jgi:hypothetical protein
MNGPDGLMAVAALQRCLQRRDYAGAAKLITLRATLDGLNGLVAYADELWESEAGRAYRVSAAVWRAEHEATLRRLQERDVAALVALVASAVSGEADDSLAGAGCAGWPARTETAA